MGLLRVCAALGGAVIAVTTAGCGGDDDDEPSAIELASSDVEGGLVELRDVACERNADQLIATGVVRNRGDNPHHVNVAVRFDDGDGVRIELASDSVSTLEPGESAHWEATVYTGERASSVETCDVTANAT